MSVQPKLNLSPFVLSTVMFDNSNSRGDQEGFLIGNAQKSVRREISDQSMYNTEEDLAISLYSCIPCGNYMSFYDSCGNVNESFVEEFLGDRRQSVVGWYRYRRNLVAFPSAREMIVHKNLKKLFPGNISFGDDYFTFGVLGSACYPSTATHTYDYAFYVQKLDSFKSLTVTLLNLGDTKTEYRGGSLSSAFINSSTFDSVLQIPWDFDSCWQTEDAVQQMHKMLREKCDGLAEELAASESVNGLIEQEVLKLDAELQSLTVKETVEATSNSDVDLENSENIPPEKGYLPLSGTHSKIFGKRDLKDLIELHEELHPLYGRFFPQNRPQDAGCSFHFSGEVTGINYNFLPPKKKIKVILQERRRILDHDYDIALDGNPPRQILPETDEDSPDVFESGGFLASDVPAYDHEEEVEYSQVDEFEMSETPGVSMSGDTKEDELNIKEEPEVKVIFLDGGGERVPEPNEEVHISQMEEFEIAEVSITSTSLEEDIIVGQQNEDSNVKAGFLDGPSNVSSNDVSGNVCCSESIHKKVAGVVDVDQALLKSGSSLQSVTEKSNLPENDGTKNTSSFKLTEKYEGSPLIICCEPAACISNPKKTACISDPKKEDLKSEK